MSEALIQEIEKRLETIAELYHRLLVLVGPPGSGKTAALRGLGERIGAPVVNLSLEVSTRLLDLSERKRALQLPVVLREIFEPEGRIQIIDNIELLFEPTLRHDPLRLLQRLGRSRTIVTSWPGMVRGERLVYAEPEHPEHRRYSIHDVELVLARPGL